MKTLQEIKTDLKNMHNVDELRDYVNDIYKHKEDYGITTKNDIMMLFIYIMQDQIKNLERNI